MAYASVVIEKIDELLNFLETSSTKVTDASSKNDSNKQDLRIPYKTPTEAVKNGEREQVLFVTVTRTNAASCRKNIEHSSNWKDVKSSKLSNESTSDFIAVVDVNPLSKTYCKIICELYLGNELELHHFGWNSCAGCIGDPNIKPRRFLIAPAFATGDVFIIDTTDVYNIKLHKKIDGKYLGETYGVSWPHTSHCLRNGTVMMSFLGFDGNDCWLIFDGRDSSFNCLGKWTHQKKNNPLHIDDKSGHHMSFAYDFWYQPYHNIMISSTWGHPESFSNGFNPNDVAKGNYGHCVHFWDWQKHQLIKTINFDPNEVTMALETRFMHDPQSSHAFINGCLTSNIIHCYLNKETNEWCANANYIKVDNVDMSNWILPSMPGLITDILISMDDKYLYFANWLHGDIRQYDISNVFEPRLTGQVFVGGLLRRDNGYDYKTKNENDSNKIDVPLINGVKILGGPQMIQLSLDGKRLYVTNSLFTPFDKQFYPNLVEKGGMMLLCDIDHENGGIKLNDKFMINFGTDTKSGVPARPHEMRYPGGDCTSDIFVDPSNWDENDQNVCCCSNGN